MGGRWPIDELLVFDEAQTYTGDPTPLAASRTYQWIHSLPRILRALTATGARPRFCSRASLVALAAVSHVHPERQRHLLPRGAPAVPLAVSLRAIKRGIGRT